MQVALAPVSVSDYRALAERRLPRQLFDYVDGGSYQELTLAANTAAFAEVRLRQRVLRNVAGLDTSREIFGQRWTMPMALAPIGYAGMLARRGERQAAKAAAQLGVPFILSTVALCSIEEVRAATTAPFWFQLYVYRDRGYARDLLARAAAAGCPVLIYTVDLAVLGARYREQRSGRGVALTPWQQMRLAADFAWHWRWLYDVALRGRPFAFGNLTGAVKNARGMNDLRRWIADNLDPSVTWRDLEWLRANWKGKIVVKGLLDPQDARAAMSAIAPDGIVVSNHGGRQLDSTPATLHALPAIREAVGDKTTVFLDGGIRSGLDVFKAIALGADACLIGRAWAYSLAAQGRAGVSAMLGTMKRDLEVTMALTGCRSVVEVNRDVLVG
jgi:L-lactate dehydrogenase (cytochrome)